LNSIEDSQREIFRGLAHILSLKDRNIEISAKTAKAFAELLQTYQVKGMNNKKKGLIK